MENLIATTQTKLTSALNNLKEAFSGVRTGRANPGLLQNVSVSAYGTMMRLADLGSISAPDPKLLVVAPFDAINVSAIEKAIREANLGLNPSSESNLIRVPLPPLSEETRQNYLKLVHDKAELGRVSLRSVRHEAMEKIEKLEKAKEISEDEKFRFKEQIQKEVDKVMLELEEIVKAKEKDLLSI